MASPIIPILLAGGAGTRLWPVSRDALPKQFLPLVGEHSTYQQTLLRVQDPMFGAPIVITGPNFHFFARRQAEDVGVEATVVIEPLRRELGGRHRRGHRGRPPARPRRGGAGARRRPHHPRRAAVPRHLSRRPRSRRGRTHRHLRHQADRAQDQLRLHPAGRGHRQERRARRQELRREAGCRDRRPLRPRRLSMEFRQLPVPRRRTAIRTWRLEPAIAAAIEACGCQRHHRPWLPASGGGSFRARTNEIDRLCGDGKDRSRRRGGGRFPLVGHRQLGCTVRYHATGCSRQCRARTGGGARCQRLRAALGRPADRRSRRQGFSSGEYVGCGDGGAARTLARGARAGGQAQVSQAAGGHRS